MEDAGSSGNKAESWSPTSFSNPHPSKPSPSDDNDAGAVPDDCDKTEMSFTEYGSVADHTEFISIQDEWVNDGNARPARMSLIARMAGVFTGLFNVKRTVRQKNPVVLPSTEARSGGRLEIGELFNLQQHVEVNTDPRPLSDFSVFHSIISINSTPHADASYVSTGEAR